MSSAVTISVVTPAYNAEAHLREALDSVLAQSWPATEILILDDGSTDGTEAVARSFGQRVRYLRQHNQGVSAARNHAVEQATGEWIAFLDSDDLWLADKLEKQAPLLSAAGLVCVYSGFTYFYADGTEMASPAFPAASLWPALRYRTPILPSTCIIRRSALLEIGGFRAGLAHSEDWEMFFRLMKRFGPAAFQSVGEPLVRYRCWNTGATQSFRKVAQSNLELLDSVLLAGLSRAPRARWLRKVQARIYFHLALRLREAHDERYWEYIIESLLRWPFAGRVVPAARYRVLLHMLYTRIRTGRLAFRFWWPVRRCRDLNT